MNKWVFSASTQDGGQQLWITDGTSEGTTLLKDINPGGSSHPSNFTPLGDGRVLFSAYDSVHGTELWITDGTSEGTTLLKDIYPGISSAHPSSLIALGDGRAVISAGDSAHGRELWITDGTAEGTVLLKDINPGSGSSSPQNFTPLGDGRALFSAYDSAHGRELWITDGTSEGTGLLKDIYPGSSSSPRNFISLGDGHALFDAYDSTLGWSLWLTDGTPEGTVLLNDHTTWWYTLGGTSLGDGRALFNAYDSTHGRELWITDGTAEGTVLLKDINPGSGSSSPQNFISLGDGRALFRAFDSTHGWELWITDGTSEGTVLLKDISPGSSSSSPQNFTSLGDGRALFSAHDSTHGQELWITDGTAEGTVLLKDIHPGSSSSHPRDFTSLGDGRALFRAFDSTHGWEAWITDGTVEGTVLLKDINPGSGSSSPSGFTPVGSPPPLPSITIVALDADKAEGDAGVTDFTFLVTLSQPASTPVSVTWSVTGAGNTPADPKDFAGGVFPSGTVTFAAGETSAIVAVPVAGDTDLEADEAFVVTLSGATGATLDDDASSAEGIIRNDDLPAPPTGDAASRILFAMSTPETGSELWISDGTESGTNLLKDINPGSGGSSPRGFAQLPNGRVVFFADDGEHGQELWVTDGTAAGTTLLRDMTPGSVGSYVELSSITPISNGRVLFGASDGTHGTELWVTDGTAAGTLMLKDIQPGNQGSSPNLFVPLANGLVVFRAGESTYGSELWVTDGTQDGTNLLRDINPGPDSSFLQGMVPMGDGRTLFRATDDVHGQEVWVTDGTTEGTILLRDINPGTASSGAQGFTLLGDGRVLFSAVDGTHGREVWVTDGTPEGTSLVRDINPGARGSGAVTFRSLGDGRAVFAGNDGTHGQELWVSDGTEAGTQLVKDINPGSGSSSPQLLGTLGDGRVLFSAIDGVHGRELWVTDGTEAGTTLVDDIVAGPQGLGSVGTMTQLSSDKLIFNLSEPVHGQEVWVSDGTAAGTFLLQDIRPGSVGSNPSDITPVGDGMAFFSAQVPGASRQPWITDGTVEGTFTLVTPPEGDYWTVSGGGGYFAAQFFLSPPEINIAALDADKFEGNEGVTKFTFLVTLSDPWTESIAVDWVVTGHGPHPADAEDFAGGVFPSGAVIFQPGQTSAVIIVPVAGDTIAEEDESFLVTLSNPIVGQLDEESAIAEGIIRTDDLPWASITALDATKFEGDEASTAFTFRVTLDEAPSEEAHVAWVVSGDGDHPASPDDFVGGTFPSGTVVFAPGEASAVITVEVAADTQPEPNESFLVTLVSPSELLITPEGATASGLVLNDDLPSLTFEPLDADRAEGADGVTPFTFLVRLDAPAQTDFAVNWSVSGSGPSPADPADFGGAFPSGIVHFASGDTEHVITVLVTGDLLSEADEGFTVTLDGSVADEAGPVSAQGVIRNDDPVAPFVDGIFLFAALDAHNGSELWASDPAFENPILLKDIHEGDLSSSPSSFVRMPDGRVVFIATDDMHGRSLWVTDGTTEGTQLWLDVVGQTDITSVSQIYAAPEGHLLLRATDITGTNRIWGTDGTVEGTEKLVSHPMLSIGPRHFEDGRVFLPVFKGNFITEVWISDGTADGTVLLEEFDPAPRTTLSPQHIWAHGDLVYFTADQGNGRQLWVTDGTLDGTGQPEVTYMGVTYDEGDNPVETQIRVPLFADFLQPFDATSVVFWGGSSGGIPSREGLYLSDGTDEGTLYLTQGQQLRAGFYGTGQPVLSTQDGQAFFAPDGGGLWASDGTVDGTRMVYDFTNGGTNIRGRVTHLTRLENGQVIFTTDDGNGQAIWRTDGTTAGTVKVTDDLIGGFWGPGVTTIVSGQVFQPLEGGRALFLYDDADDQQALWVTDATETGTQLIAPLGAMGLSYAGQSAGGHQVLPDGRILFRVEDADGVSSRWITDGTVEGTRQFQELPPELLGLGTIFSMPPLSTISISELDADKPEGDEGITDFTFLISLSEAQATDVSVAWSVTGHGTNPADADDFEGGMFPEGAVLFAPGETTAIITVPVMGDFVVEADEGFGVTILDPTGATISPAYSTAYGVIQNDDVALNVEDDFAQVDQDDSVSGNLLSNDTGAGLVLVSVDGVSINEETDISVNFGLLRIDQNGNYHYSANAAAFLPSGVTAQETLTYLVSDASGDTAEGRLSITIHGINDPASIAGDSDGLVVEDDPDRAQASGVLTVSDPDAGEDRFAQVDAAALAGDYGNFGFGPLTGAWSYTLANDSATVQALPEGAEVTDSLTVTSIDGTASETITVTIRGVNDPASIAGDSTGLVVEDDADRMQASGVLTSTDPDAGEERFALIDPSALAGDFGVFAFDPATGAWTYTLGNDLDAVQALPEGAEVTDSLSVASVDGTASETITVTIRGVNDPANIAGDSTGLVVEDDSDRAQATGVLSVTDPDAGEDRFAEVDPTALAGEFGSFTFDPENGAWSYTLDINLDAVQALPEGAEVTDSLSVTSLDGTAEEVIAVTILGAGVATPEPSETITLQGVIQGRSGKAMDGVTVTFTPDDGSTAIDIASTADGFDISAAAGASGRITASRDYSPEADGNVTALDALNVLRLAVGLSPSWGPASPMDFIAADINQDGQVTALDALEVLRAAVGLQSANQPRWFFMDSEADLSHIDRNDTQVEEGIRIDPSVTDISSLSMTGVLLGNMQEYA